MPVDVEHLTIIPMDAPTPPTTPLGPMKRARAKAINDKVNSLLYELPLSMHETWLLPKSDLLCMIKYQEDPPKDAHEDVQVPSSRMKRTNGRSQAHLLGPGYPSTTPDIRPLELHPPQPLSCQDATGPGHPILAEVSDIRPPARKSGHPRTREQHGQLHQPGHPASTAWTSGPSRTPGHPTPVCAQ